MPKSDVLLFVFRVLSVIVLFSSIQALWLKPDDQFCTEMLTKALEDESRGPSNWLESRDS